MLENRRRRKISNPKKAKKRGKENQQRREGESQGVKQQKNSLRSRKSK